MGDPILDAGRACEARLERTRRSSLFQLWDDTIEGGEGRLHAILGTPGSGKSTLALLYLAYRYSCDLQEIRRRLVWRPDEFLRVYREGRDLIVWDDAGVWMRIIARMHWDPLAITINSVFDVGRLQAPLVLFTMLTDRDLPRPIRYNSMLYRSRTRVWRTGFLEDRRVYRALAVTQFRREKADWSQSYWDASNEYALKFYHFRRGDPFYAWYLQLRREYARFFLDYAARNLEKSRLYELLQQQG